MVKECIVTVGSDQRKMVFSKFLFSHWECVGSCSFPWHGPWPEAVKLAKKVGGIVEPYKGRKHKWPKA